MSIRLSLRILGLRVELHTMSIGDPKYAKTVLRSLECRRDVSTSDELDDTTAQLESHMNTQLLKEFATLSASNATKKAKGKGAAEDDK